MSRRTRSILAAKLLSLSRSMLRHDRRPLPRLLEAGLAVKLDGENGEALRSRLDSTFEFLGADGAAAMIDLHRIRPLLERTEYKYSLYGNKWSDGAGDATFRIASRLATGRGITFDVLVLRCGEAIAPHIHDGTVSGMLVVDGEVGFQTYDVIESTASGAILKPGLAGKYGPGGVSTSSTLHHNLHWIHGFAPISYILRFTVTNIGSTRSESEARSGARQYCIPRESLPGGLVRGHWSTAEEANATPFPALGPDAVDAASRPDPFARTRPPFLLATPGSR